MCTRFVFCLDSWLLHFTGPWLQLFTAWWRTLIPLQAITEKCARASNFKEMARKSSTYFQSKWKRCWSVCLLLHDVYTLSNFKIRCDVTSNRLQHACFAAIPHILHMHFMVSLLKCVLPKATTSLILKLDRIQLYCLELCKKYWGNCLCTVWAVSLHTKCSIRCIDDRAQVDQFREPFMIHIYCFLYGIGIEFISVISVISSHFIACLSYNSLATS